MTDPLLSLVLIVTIVLLVFRAFTPPVGDRPVVVVMAPPEPENTAGCLPLVLLGGLILLLLAANGITLTP